MCLAANLLLLLAPPLVLLLLLPHLLLHIVVEVMFGIPLFGGGPKAGR